MAFEAMRNKSIAEDGYGPSEDEDDDYYGKFARREVAVLKDFTGKRKKRKRKRERGNTKFEEKDCDFQENLQDPLVVFGWDIMLMILSHLDARSVALSLIVSRSWHGVASSDAIWSKKTQIKILNSSYLLLVGGLMDDTQETLRE